MAFAYSNRYNLKTTGLRIFSAYTPNGRPDMALWIFNANIGDDYTPAIANGNNVFRDFRVLRDFKSPKQKRNIPLLYFVATKNKSKQSGRYGTTE